MTERILSPAEVEALLMSGGNGTERALCSTCGRVFTTASNFDRHLMPAKVRLDESYEGPWCQDPDVVGLEQDDRGVWRLPSPDGPIYPRRPVREPS